MLIIFFCSRGLLNFISANTSFVLNADKMRYAILRNPMGYSKRERSKGMAVVLRVTRVVSMAMFAMDVLVP